MTLNELAAHIHEQAKSNGFHDNPRRLPEILALAHSELSESFEAWRDNPNRAVFYGDDGKPEGWATEIIDCIIVCMDILGSSGTNVDKIMETKLAYNRSRPVRHGRGI